MAGDSPKEIFVSCSNQDREVAAELVAGLEKLGRTAFIFTRDLPAAIEWEEALVRNLQGARLVAVLLSSHTRKAHYQRVEIRLAIQEHRKDASSLRIAPVALERLSDPLVGFGLNGFQQIDLAEIGVPATAARLAELLDGGDPAGAGDPGPGGPASELPHTIGAYFHRAALKLDRSRQWLPIRDLCAGTENAFFLLHGPRQQNLDLFVARLWLYLSGECERPHHCFVVPLTVDGVRPRSAAGWETNLAYGLSRRGRRAGRAVDLLREAARKRSVFLVLNRLPIGADDLEEDELEALEDFLSRGLPKLITEASRGGHPIRALLATHYDQEEESLTERLDDKAVQGCESAGLRYRKLAPVQPLEWTHVEDYLDGLPKRPPKRIYRKLKASFERLDSENLQFQDVVELLERELGD